MVLVHFTSSFDSFHGEYSLNVRFTTTKAGLASFLDASHLSRPSAATQATAGDWPRYPVTTAAQGPCGLIPPDDQHMVYSQYPPDSPMSGTRSLAVDLSDPAHPVVWVEALDL
jgi:hypothetical protein